MSEFPISIIFQILQNYWHFLLLFLLYNHKLKDFIEKLINQLIFWKSENLPNSAILSKILPNHENATNIEFFSFSNLNVIQNTSVETMMIKYVYNLIGKPFKTNVL